MAKFIEEKRFDGGLNQDDEPRRLPEGDYPFMRDMRNGSSEGSNLGTPESVKGNKLIPFTLPAGLNKVIGSFEDKEEITVIDAIFNDQGNHTIRQYFPDDDTAKLVMQDPLFDFASDKNVNLRLVNKDLLYILQKNRTPRKINLKKAKDDKPIIYNIYFGPDDSDILFKTGTFFIINITNITVPGQQPNQQATFVYPTSIEGNLKDGVDAVADFIRNIFGDIFEVEDCNNFITLTAKADGYIEVVIIIANGTDKSIAVPQNYYHTTLVEENINAAKSPPACEPKVSIISDPTKGYNKISGQVFQFRASYIFDDDEESTLGPISHIPFDNISCSPQLVETGLNGIEIDFTDDRLNNLSSLAIIKRVALYVREGNDGKWKLITTLDQQDFGIGKNVFNFFNDSIPSVIANKKAIKPFDSIPIEAGTQEFAKNKMWYGNCLESYDPVCIETEFVIGYEQPVDNPLFSISGKIFIRNLFDIGTDFRAQQPIHNLGDGPVWGGFSNNDTVGDVGPSYRQTIPLSGFVVYLAETDLYAVSKQNDPGVVDVSNIGNNDRRVTLENNNVYRSVQNSILGCGNEDRDRSNIKCAIKNGDVFSNFEIKNVPAGKYILRVASHNTTDDELNDPGRIYQKGSTNVFDIAGNGSTEVIVTVTNSGVDIGIISIADLTDPSIDHQSTALTGYVTDMDITPTPTDLLTDTRIELARVDFKGGLSWSGIDFSNIFNEWGTLPTHVIGMGVTEPHAYTDHNGYFFYARTKLGAPIFNTKVEGTRSSDIDLSPQLFNLDGSSFGGVSGSKGAEIIVRNTKQEVSDFARTRLRIQAIDSDGVSVSGVGATTTRGRSVITQQDGRAEITVYGDTRRFDVVGLYRRDDIVIYSGTDSSCLFSIVPLSEFWDILIGITSGYHNNTNTFFDLQPVTVDQLSAASGNALKRGGNYDLGIVYFDDINRQNAVNASEDAKLQIPFYTEKDPITGVINNTGIPIVTWKIFHAPPEFATHYQWVRTRNTFTSEYLQWAAKEVKFIDDFGDSASFVDATKITLDIANIGDYKTKFPNSKVGITPEEGWRVRFMYDGGGTFFTSYIDVEILQFSGTIITIYKNTDLGEIEDGTAMEIYNPKLDVEEKIYSEWGECYEIGINEDGKKFHKGPLLNQTFAPGGHAGGVFQTGDAWYRRRIFPIMNGTRNLAIDDESISDFYISKASSIGRAQGENANQKQILRETITRFSNGLFPDGTINGLSTFDSEDSEDLPRENGPITGFQMTENVLLSIHSLRTTSIYIDESIITTTSGEDSITKSNKTVGATRTLRGRFGTIHPESITEHKGNVYSWDANKGAWLRYSVNGLFPISDYKMRTFFANIAKEMLLLKDPTEAKVYSAYDSFHDQLVVSMPKVELLTGAFRPGQGGIDSVAFAAGTDMSIFIVGDFITLTYFDIRVGKYVTDSFEIVSVQDFYLNINALEAELSDALNELDPMITEVVIQDPNRRRTLAFSETRIRWTEFFSYQPEYLGQTGIDLVSYDKGDLYRHNANDLHANYYGEQFNPQVQIIANGDPSKVKTFVGMSIESDDIWFVPEDEITIPADAQNPNGMKSQLTKARFRLTEGVFYAEFLRDVNTPGNFLNPEDALVNGRQLRGHVFIVLIENDSSKLVVLYAINIQSTASELSKSSQS